MDFLSVSIIFNLFLLVIVYAPFLLRLFRKEK